MDKWANFEKHLCEIKDFKIFYIYYFYKSQKYFNNKYITSSQPAARI